ncbi:IS3 family transposase [Chromobacterium sphagni]|uniref:IS3 family transposase n=1 Tax=Chromobacterium sphagni TaxID=1903179 RepID=UPI00130182E3
MTYGIENIFRMPKREHIKDKIYQSRKKAHRNIFDCIEWFYNLKPRRNYAGGLAPV